MARLVRYEYQGQVGHARVGETGELIGLNGPLVDDVHLDQVTVLAPCVPSKIIGIGLNYRAHAEEMGKALPAEPLMFLMPPSAVIATNQAIVCPAGYERVDFEGELAVVIGRRARHVSRDHALDYLAGFTCFNDVTVRDLQKKDVQYSRAKGFDTFAPIGPCIATDLDPRHLTITTRVDGVVRQHSNTADMIFDVQTLIAAVSRVMTLEPGDVIATGTPPGVGPIAPGMNIEIEIEHIGVLRNKVIAEKIDGVLREKTT